MYTEDLEDVLIIIAHIKLECGAEDTFVVSVLDITCTLPNIYSPVLGALLDTELRTASIQNDGSLLL